MSFDLKISIRQNFKSLLFQVIRSVYKKYNKLQQIYTNSILFTQFLNTKILYINVREMNKKKSKGGIYMRKSNYEFITLNAYIDNLDDRNVISLNDKSIEREVEKYLSKLKKIESDANTVEYLVG